MVLVSLLATLILASACSSAAPIVGTTFPPAVPTRTVDAEKVIAGLRAALGPDKPLHIKATAAARAGGAVAFILEGDMQGNEMNARASYRMGNVQLSFDVIAAGGKAYVRPYKGKWAKSPEKVPPETGGPFGDMSEAKLEFQGPSKTDRDLYTVNWDQAIYAARALHGTLYSSVKVKSAVMQFQVDANGKPYSATYLLKGTGKVDGKSYPLDVKGYYQFFAVRQPLTFESPLKK